MIKIILATLIIFGVTATGWCGNFKNNGDATVTDIATGLIWQQEDDNVRRTWEEAIIYCEGMKNANYEDWRLPNIKELRTIIDMTTSGPAIDPIAFPGTNVSFYWSATTLASNSEYAWSVEFTSGWVFYGLKFPDTNFVRCVR